MKFSTIDASTGPDVQYIYTYIYQVWPFVWILYDIWQGQRVVAPAWCGSVSQCLLRGEDPPLEYCNVGVGEDGVRVVDGMRVRVG